ncbi:hypothetical protein NECAME_18637, partial [Necator americanus]
TTTSSTESNPATEVVEKAEEIEANTEKEQTDNRTTVHPSEHNDGETESKSGEESGIEDESSNVGEQSSDTRSTEKTTSQESSTVNSPPITSGKSSDEEDAEDATSTEFTSTTTDAIATTNSEPVEKNGEDDEEYVNEDENGGEVETVTSSDGSFEKINKKGEKASYIKFKKHPKNFASKTANLSEKEAEVTEEVNLFSFQQ